MNILVKSIAFPVCCSLIFAIASCITDPEYAVNSYKADNNTITVEFYKKNPTFKNVALLDAKGASGNIDDIRVSFQSGKCTVIDILTLNDIEVTNGKYTACFHVDCYENANKFIFVTYTPYEDNVVDVDFLAIIEPEDQ